MWFSLRNLKNRRGRAFAVLVGIAVGAAVFGSVRLSIQASIQSFTRSVDAFTGTADSVLVQSGERLDETLILPLLMDPGVKQVAPVLSAYVTLELPNAEPLLVIGIDPILDRGFRTWNASSTPSSEDQQQAAWSDLIKTPYSLIAGKAFWQRFHLQPGSQIPLSYGNRQQAFRVLDQLDSNGLGQVEGGLLAITDIATFQEFTGLFGKVDRIDLQYQEGRSSEVKARLRTWLPDGVMLARPSDKRESGLGMISAYRLNLSILSFVSLFVGMFLIYSIVALNASARRHEIAVLRSLGASSGLIFKLFVAEGVFLGCMGWLLSIPICIVMVKYLLSGISESISILFVRVYVQQLHIDLWEIILSFSATLAVSFLAALQPAWEATQVAPKEAMTPVNSHQMGRTAGRLAIMGTGLIALVWPLTLIPVAAGPPWPGYAATFFLFAGFALLSPWTLQKTGRWLEYACSRTAAVPAFLASRYLRESRLRISISIGALITAVALYTSLSIMIFSFRQSVASWVQQTVTGDLFVSPKLAEINRWRDPLPTSAVKVLKELKSPVDVEASRRIYRSYQGFPYLFEAIDLDTFFLYGGFNWQRGDPRQVHPLLLKGEGVVVSEVFANRTGLDLGDKMILPMEGDSLELPILGVIRDYRSRGGVVFYSLPHYQQRTGDFLWSRARLYFQDSTHATPEAMAELKTELITRCQNDIGILEGRTLRAAILDIFDETFSVTVLLLLIALLVALLGVSTTLTLLAIERTKQLHIMTAVGASRGQIRWMILGEASMMVAVGELLGLLCGILLACLLVFVINKQSFGWTFVFAIDWPALCSSLPIIYLTALLTVLPAARMALQQSAAALLRER
jgi:putative ABC transport system permease protein